MCLNPILIENPYRGLKSVGLNRFHDCTSAYLPVPCGNCSECISLRQMYIVQRCQMEAMNNHLFMCTLTYNNESLKTVDVNGYIYAYPYWKDIQNMFKRIRKAGYQFKYMCVSEYGGRKHRPHYHMIISLPKTKVLPHDLLYEARLLESCWSRLLFHEWRRNVGSTRSPIYTSLFTYHANSRGSNFDFHYIDPSGTEAGESDVAFYVSKYLLKCDPWLDRVKSALKLNLSDDEFVEVWKLLKPRCCISKHWGLSHNSNVKEWIRKGIKAAILQKSEYPYFIAPNSGQSQPLSPYYQRKYITLSDSEEFYKYKTKEINTIDVIYDAEEYDPAQVYSDIRRFQKVKESIALDLISFDEFLEYDTEDQINLDQVPQGDSYCPRRSYWSNSDFETCEFYD